MLDTSAQLIGDIDHNKILLFSQFTLKV